MTMVLLPTKVSGFPHFPTICGSAPSGWRKITAKMCAWSPPESIGYPFTTFWRPSVLSFWPTSNTSRRSEEEKQKKDDKWIADIYKHDLVSGNFIPPADIRQLRDLMRYHWKLTSLPYITRFHFKRPASSSNTKGIWYPFRLAALDY